MSEAIRMRRGPCGSPEFMEHQQHLGELYRYLRIKYIEQDDGWVSHATDERAYREAMEALPFEITES